MRRKGQAAMEFLMTYGWAILAAIIVIGVLAVYFRPSALTVGQTIVTAPFYANAWNVQGTAVQIELQNNGGEQYNITSVDIQLTQPSSIDCTADTSVGVVNAGELATANVTCTGVNSGDSVQGDITILYTKQGSALELTSTGTIADSSN